MLVLVLVPGLVPEVPGLAQVPGLALVELELDLDLQLVVKLDPVLQ